MATVKTLIGNVRGPAGPAPTVKSTTRKSGDHTPGTDDTYRVEFENGSAFEFPVYNGLNGEGSVKTVNGVHADSNGNVDLNDKQPLVVGKAGGSDTLVLEHSGKGPLLGLTMYGKSTQDGTPTPNNPIPIKSVENPVVTVTGKNLFNGPDKSTTKNGITFTLRENKLTAVGMATENALFPMMTINNKWKGKFLQITDKFNGEIFIQRAGAPYDNIASIKAGTLTSKIEEPNNEKYTLYALILKGTSINTSAYIMVVDEPSNSPNYEPYRAPQNATLDFTLRSVGDVRDELTVYADGTGEIKRRVGVNTIDTVEKARMNYGNAGEYSNTNAYSAYGNFGCENIKKINERKLDFLCDKLTPLMPDETRTNVISHANDYFILSIADATSATFDEKLAALAPTICYPLETPTTETLSASQVQQVLALNTLSPTTVLTNDQGAEMAVHYVGEGGESLVNPAQKEEDTDALEKRMLLAAHPVGSLYWSSVATDPGTLFGGTWARIKDTFILAAGDSYAVGSSGGEATHTLTTNEMPSHTHRQRSRGNNNIGESGNSIGQEFLGTSSTFIGTTEATGGGGAHNNMPPYETYYCWRRTA